MKIIISNLLLSIMTVANGQLTKKADSISPEDFGAHKWTLSGTAKEYEAVIFRATTVRKRKDHTDTEVYDSVSYQPQRESQKNVFFYDPDFFNADKTEEPNWFWKALGGTGWISGAWAGSKTSENKIEIYFESEEWGRTEKTFEVLIIPYLKAKQLHPDLPEIQKNQSWGWSGLHPKSEPGESGNG